MLSRASFSLYLRTESYIVIIQSFIPIAISTDHFISQSLSWRTLFWRCSRHTLAVELNFLAAFCGETETQKPLCLVCCLAIQAISKIARLEFGSNTKLCPLTYPLFIPTLEGNKSKKRRGRPSSEPTIALSQYISLTNKKDNRITWAAGDTCQML
jgi:hypothetical protein